MKPPLKQIETYYGIEKASKQIRNWLYDHMSIIPGDKLSLVSHSYGGWLARDMLYHWSIEKRLQFDLLIKKNLILLSGPHAGMSIQDNTFMYFAASVLYNVFTFTEVFGAEQINLNNYLTMIASKKYTDVLLKFDNVALYGEIGFFLSYRGNTAAYLTNPVSNAFLDGIEKGLSFFSMTSTVEALQTFRSIAYTRRDFVVASVSTLMVPYDYDFGYALSRGRYDPRTPHEILVDGEDPERKEKVKDENITLNKSYLITPTEIANAIIDVADEIDTVASTSYGLEILQSYAKAYSPNPCGLVALKEMAELVMAWITNALTYEFNQHNIERRSSFLQDLSSCIKSYADLAIQSQTTFNKVTKMLADHVKGPNVHRYSLYADKWTYLYTWDPAAAHMMTSGFFVGDPAIRTFLCFPKPVFGKLLLRRLLLHIGNRFLL